MNIDEPEMIPRADADLAVALMVEPLLKLREGIEADIRSAHHGRGNGSSSAMREDDRDFRAAVAAAFDALAPDAGTAALAELQALRDERDALATKNAAIEKRLRERRAMHRVNSVLQNSAVIRARLAGPTPFDAVTIADLEELFTDAASRAEAAEAELATLQAQVERLTGALRFYADFHENPNDGPWGINSQDFGKEARAALTEGAAP